MIRIVLAVAKVEPCRQRELVPVIARQVDGDDVRIRISHALHDRPAAVARPVIDQHQLVIFANRNLRRGAQPLVKLRQARFFVEAGNDDRQRGHGRV